MRSGWLLLPTFSQVSLPQSGRGKRKNIRISLAPADFSHTRLVEFPHVSVARSLSHILRDLDTRREYRVPPRAAPAARCDRTRIQRGRLWLRSKSGGELMFALVIEAVAAIVFDDTLTPVLDQLISPPGVTAFRGLADRPGQQHRATSAARCGKLYRRPFIRDVDHATPLASGW